MFFEKEYAVGRVRAMRARTLGENALADIGSAQSISDMLLTLAGTPYEHAFAKRNLVHNERMLSMHTAEILKKVLDFLPQDYYLGLSMFSLEADARNLKICVRGLSEGRKWGKIRRGFLALGSVHEKTANVDILDFEALLATLEGTSWHGALTSCRALFDEKNIALLEHEIDRHFFAHAGESCSGSVRRFFLEKEELHDLRIIALAEGVGVPVPTEFIFLPQLSENITKKYAHLLSGSLERNIQKHLMALSHELMLLEPFSFGLFIEFFCRTENEERHLARAARHISSKIQSVAGVPE